MQLIILQEVLPTRQQLISMDLDFRNVSKFMNHLFWFCTEGLNWLIVVSLVVDHVDLGGSRFSELVLERWHFAIASQ